MKTWIYNNLLGISAGDRWTVRAFDIFIAVLISVLISLILR